MEKNVTNSMKKDKYVKKLVRDILSYATIWLSEWHYSGNKTVVKEKLEGYNLLSIAAYVGYQNGKFEFTKKFRKLLMIYLEKRPK